MKEFVTIGYSYNELSDTAKEKVKQWYLNDPLRNDIFLEDITNYLLENFPNSELKAQYDLGYSQGDGLNIYGILNLYDFWEKWTASEENKKTMKKYFVNDKNNKVYIGMIYKFTFNNRYCYSCKFIDKKHIDSTIEEFIQNYTIYELSDKSLNDLISQFFNDMLNYFEDLDKTFEKNGYNYLYNCTDEEVKEVCNANDYYFTIEGDFIS